MKKVIPIILLVSFVFMSCSAKPTYIELEKLPHDYSDTIAKENGDVVSSNDEVYNLQAFDDFLKNIEESKEDRIRVTTYTVEGEPVIHDLINDGKMVKMFIDTTRDSHGQKGIVQYKVKEIKKKVTGKLVEYYAVTEDKDTNPSIMVYLQK